MTDPLNPPVCRSLLGGLPCENKPKWVVTEQDDLLTYCCVVHKQEALDDGLEVRAIDEVTPG